MSNNPIDSVFVPLFTAQNSMSQDLVKFSHSMDKTNPGDLLNFQQKMMDYSVTTGAATATLHAFSQMMQGIVQKIG